jgi:hypothetical protein
VALIARSAEIASGIRVPTSMAADDSNCAARQRQARSGDRAGRSFSAGTTPPTCWRSRNIWWSVGAATRWLLRHFRRGFLRQRPCLGRNWPRTDTSLRWPAPRAARTSASYPGDGVELHEGAVTDPGHYAHAAHARETGPSDQRTVSNRQLRPPFFLSDHVKGGSVQRSACGG